MHGKGKFTWRGKPRTRPEGPKFHMKFRGKVFGLGLGTLSESLSVFQAKVSKKNETRPDGRVYEGEYINDIKAEIFTEPSNLRRMNTIITIH